ncbi:MAG: site-specific DNA-methyltransferase [Kiritimatiellae bacterium]|nr:site-specific DNA-methyltransferase [Kiritimatiellia bacterium]
MATGVSATKWNCERNPIARTSAGADVSVTLSYAGKKSVDEILCGLKAEVFKVWGAADDAVKMENRLYWGDNLSILRGMLNDERIHGKVKLVYIDPPYATNSVFQSREQKDAYADLLQGSHFVEFLRERLLVIRELLAPDGSIYVHLDDNMAFEIKMIMDEVFGKEHFQNWITRKKCSTKNTTRKRFGNIADYILFYTKSDEYIWNRPFDPWNEERIAEEYPYVDEKTGRRYKRVPVHAPGTRNGATGGPWRGMMPPKGKHWQYTPATLDELDANGEIYWSKNGNPRRKVFFDPSKGIPQQDIWLNYRDSINQNMVITGYPTEKNLAMLENIIAASSNPGDLVLDAFCGSGTTMQAAYNLGRTWIGIDCEEEAVCSVLKRFNFGSEKMGDFVTEKAAKTYKPHELLDEKNFAQSLFGTCPFQFLVAEDKLDQAKADFKVKIPESAKHSVLSDIAKKAVDPAIKVASLAVLAKVISS